RDRQRPLEELRSLRDEDLQRGSLLLLHRLGFDLRGRGRVDLRSAVQLEPSKVEGRKSKVRIRIPWTLGPLDPWPLDAAQTLLSAEPCACAGSTPSSSTSPSPARRYNRA